MYRSHSLRVIFLAGNTPVKTQTAATAYWYKNSYAIVLHLQCSVVLT